MIKDRLKNAENYYKLSENIQQAFLWLKKQNLQTLPDGKYEIDGENIYANIQQYTTKDDAKYEAHKKYIDIQYMIKGTELVGVLDIDECITSEEYNSEKDIIFLTSDKNDEYYTLKSGDFLILFPTDAHKPSIKTEKNDIVKKIVVKVAINPTF